MSLVAASKHVTVLERAGLVNRERGVAVRSARRAGALDEASDWLARHRALWHERLDDLERCLSTEPATGDQTGEERP